MKEIVLHDKTFVPFIANDEIEKAIDSVAARLNAKYKGTGEIPVILCLLNGALMFTASLMRRLEFNVDLASMKVSSYAGTQSTGNVRIVREPTTDLKGRHVIICEDIVDTGNTMVFMDKYLKEQGAASMEICIMLLKPDVYDKPVKLDYVGMEIPNRFIVGYGLDYDELGRNYPDIYVLKQ